MSTSFPPEIFDLIVDHLHISDDLTTLMACSLLSKSWVPRARKYLFACVVFGNTPVESWIAAFPDPSNSPAYYARTLSIWGLPDSTVTSCAYACIRSFNNIVNLTVDTIPSMDGSPASLVSLHALSPRLKSLRVIYDCISPEEVFGLISSFPSLENLSLKSIRYQEPGSLNIPSVSPKFTGSLSLAMNYGIPSCIYRLLAFPGGLHFSEIFVQFCTGDGRSLTDLVSACRNTLESIGVLCNSQTPGVSPDLSKATKLKVVEFHSKRLSVRWIAATLQTIKSRNLKQITIRQGDIPYQDPEIVGRVLPGWQDLDHLLVQFWMLRSIRPKLVGRLWGREGFAPTFLPELTGRGLLDIA